MVVARIRGSAGNVRRIAAARQPRIHARRPIETDCVDGRRIGRIRITEGSAVLNDREREALREVERRLLSEDPRFVRSFIARAQRLPQASGARVGIKSFLFAGLLVCAVMLLIGSVPGALAFAVATGAIWLSWRFGPDAEQQSR
jgi:hypothetical protein